MAYAMTADEWAALIGPSARILYADRPIAEAGDDLRIGNKGSVMVHVAGPRAGTFTDFDGGVSGGTLDLVKHVRGCDKAGALEWLRAEGFLPDDANGDRPPRARRKLERSIQPAWTPPDPGPIAETSETSETAARIIERSVDAASTPAMVYLVGRKCIRPDDPPPRWVRWIDREACPFLPREAVGGICYLMARPGCAPDAVHVEGLTAEGDRLQARFRKNYGVAKGRCFFARSDPTGPIYLCEGPLDALALATCGARGSVRAAVAKIDLASCADPAERYGELRLFPDSDDYDRSRTLDRDLFDLGRGSLLTRLPEGDDPASVLQSYVETHGWPPPDWRLDEYLRGAPYDDDGSREVTETEPAPPVVRAVVRDIRAAVRPDEPPAVDVPDAAVIGDDEPAPGAERPDDLYAKLERKVSELSDDGLLDDEAFRNLPPEMFALSDNARRVELRKRGLLAEHDRRRLEAARGTDISDTDTGEQEIF